jgi:hypothetical protein
MPAISGRATDRRTALLLFLTLHFLYLLTSSGRVRTMDEVTVDYEVESVATRGSTAIPQAAAAGYFYGKNDRFGRPQGPYGPANAALVVPWYWAGRALGAVLPGIPKPASTLFTDAFVTASSAAFSAAAVALFFLLLRRKDVAQKPALMAAVLVALATPVFCFSSWFFSEPLATALLLAGVYWLFRRGSEEPITIRDAAWGGTLLGLLVWVRMTHAIVLPVAVLGMLIRGGKKNLRAAVVLCVVSGVFCAAYLARNYHLFGNPFDAGYPSHAEGGKNVVGFDTPPLKGLGIFLFSPGKSIFLFAPPLLLAIAGWKALARRDRGLAFVACGVPLVYLLFYARYSYLEGAYSYGPRYLVPVIALFCMGLGPALERTEPWVKPTAIVVFLSGFFVQCVGMATNFMEDMTGGKYYDANWMYRPDYSPFGSMIKRFWHYATMDGPAPLGRGFDRWFVFLPKAGVAHGLIVAGILIEAAGLAYCGWRLARSMKEDPATLA